MASSNEKTLLVVLEQHFIKDGSDVYTDVQCDERFWDRYLSVFDRLIVCARMRQAESDDDLVAMLHSSRPEVEFVAMPDFVGASGPVRHYRAIRRAVKECLRRADAAICRLPSPISLVACPVFERSGVPWAGEMMMNPRTAYSRESMDHLLQPIIQLAAVRSTKKACLAANGVSYVTERVLQEEYPCRAITDPHAKDYFTSSYSTISLSDDMFSMANWGNECPSKVVLAHTGKMSDYRKGHVVFIKTVALLRKRGVNAFGILIGDGPKRAEFESLAKSLGVQDFCEFSGWASGFEEVQKRLQRAHFFLLPTLSEGLPRAIIEAMASGLICLGNNVDGIPELLAQECLSGDNSPKSYAYLVCSLLADWPHALEVREKQFARSRDYESSHLMKRRKIFYYSLRKNIEGGGRP